MTDFSIGSMFNANKNMKNKLIVVVGVIIILVAGVWYGVARKASAPTNELAKVKIANLSVAHGLPVYLALEKGYFKAAGLDVELVKFEAPNQIIDALLQGQVDLSSPAGAMGIAGIADFKNPGKLKIYAAAGGDDVVQDDAILVKNGSSIKTLSDLKGKKLGIVAGSIQWRTIARAILAKNNLSADQDVALVELPVGLQAQALGSGQVDALLGLEPTPTIIKAQNIGHEIVDHATTRFISNPFYPGAGIIRSDFIAQNPEVAKKVLAVIDRAITEINQNPDAARQYLKGYTALNDATIAQVPILRFKMSAAFQSSDLVAVQKFYDIFSEFKVVDGQIDFGKMILGSATN